MIDVGDGFSFPDGEGFGDGDGIGYGDGYANGAGYGYCYGYTDGCGLDDRYGYGYCGAYGDAPNGSGIGSGVGNAYGDGDINGNSNAHAQTQSDLERRPRIMRPILVTTAHRGVFFGYADGDTSGKTIKLRRGRNCLYWSADVKGFLGLAANGPTAGCRVGPAADIELHDVTSVSDVTPAAVEAWEAAPWA